MDLNPLEWFGVAFIASAALMLALALYAAAESAWKQWKDARAARRNWWVKQLHDAERARQNADIDKAVRDWEAK